MSDTVSSFDAARPLCDRAEALIDAGRPTEALPLLAQAIAAEPGHTRAHCLRSLALMKQEQYPAALRSAETAVSLAPTEEWGHRLRAIVLLEMGRKRQALAPAREAARLAPWEPSVLHTLARSELASGKKREARETAERLRSAAPEWNSSHELLGLIALEERHAKVAEAHYRDALRLHPGSWVAMNNLGLALQRQGRRKEAIECFHQAARLNPTKELIRKNLSGAVRNYMGVGSLGLIWAVVYGIRALLTASHSGNRGDSLPPWALGLTLGAVAAVLLIGYVVRKRRLAELHPEVGNFYQDETARERRRRFHEIPLLVMAAICGFCGLLALGYAAAQMAHGPANGLGTALDGIVPYAVLSVAALSVAGGLAWLSWRKRHPH